MSKISIHGNVMLKGIKIYAEAGTLYASLIGEAMSNIGPVNFNFNKVALDFNVPEYTDVASFSFRDGKGHVGYNFNFGDVLYVNEDDDVMEVNVDTENSENIVEENTIDAEENNNQDGEVSE